MKKFQSNCGCKSRASYFHTIQSVQSPFYLNIHAISNMNHNAIQRYYPSILVVIIYWMKNIFTWSEIDKILSIYIDQGLSRSARNSGETRFDFHWLLAHSMQFFLFINCNKDVYYNFILVQYMMGQHLTVFSPATAYKTLLTLHLHLGVGFSHGNTHF